MKKHRAAALVLAILAAAAPLGAQVLSTFDTDLDGWRILGDNSALWQSTGGNPAGCLDVNDRAVGDINWASAPYKFLGNWSAFTPADSIFFDIYEVNTSGGAWLAVHHVRIEGPGGAAWANDVRVVNPPAQGVWIHVRIMMTPEVWTLESGTWLGLLANVTSVRIFAEWVNGAETTWLDNIGISRAPAPLNRDCLENTMDSGIGDWSFLTAGTVSNPGSGGNGGGFLQIGDATGNSYALAPAMFLGDWSQYELAGFVTVDLRVLGSSGNNLGSPDFIRISGPGGSAHVALTAEDLTIPAGVWKTFSFPIDFHDWTIDSGAWNDLIANVTECRIDAEYFDNTETIGLDNFGLRMDSCPRIDDLVETFDATYPLCGITSLVGVSVVALNPMDGELYGLLRASSGGLFRVTGAQAGVFLATYSNPADLLFAANGDAFISEDYSGNIYRMAWGGASSVWVAGLHSGDDDPYGMTFAPPGFDGANVNPGDILVSDRGYGGADEIWSFSPSVAEGELLVMSDPGEIEFFDLCAGGYDTVYVADALDGDHIRFLRDDGTPGGFILDPPLSSPYSVVYDSLMDVLFVADGSTKSIHRVNPHTGSWTRVADGFNTFNPCCLEIDVLGRRLYVADAGYNRVYEICLETVTAVEETAPRASSLALRAYPNPFNPSVTLVYTLADASKVRIEIYDAAGRLVRTLLDERREAGSHRAFWNGRDGAGRPAAAGVYFARIDALEKTESRKLVLVR
jgi:DNA-binding beta-propeller fold protein YncE